MCSGLALRALFAGIAFVALLTLRTLRSGLSLRPLFTLRTLGSGLSGIAFVALFTLRALCSGLSLRSLLAGVSLVSFDISGVLFCLVRVADYKVAFLVDFGFRDASAVVPFISFVALQVCV